MANYITLQAEVTYRDKEGEDCLIIDFDPYLDCTDVESMREYMKEHMPEGAELLDVKITDFDGVPEDYANENKIWKLADALAQCDQDIDIVAAALYLGIAPEEIDEAYLGEFASDEDFARDMAEHLGCIDKNARWPQTCIDWELAALELMHDYSKSDYYYFRDL